MADKTDPAASAAGKGHTPAELREQIMALAGKADAAAEAGDDAGADRAIEQANALIDVYKAQTGMLIGYNGREYRDPEDAHSLELTDRERLAEAGIDPTGLTIEEAAERAAVVRDAEQAAVDEQFAKDVRDLVSDVTGVDASRLTDAELQELVDANQRLFDRYELTQHDNIDDPEVREHLGAETTDLLDHPPATVVPKGLEGKVGRTVDPDGGIGGAAGVGTGGPADTPPDEDVTAGPGVPVADVAPPASRPGAGVGDGSGGGARPGAGGAAVPVGDGSGGGTGPGAGGAGAVPDATPGSPGGGGAGAPDASGGSGFPVGHDPNASADTAPATGETVPAAPVATAEVGGQEVTIFLNAEGDLVFADGTTFEDTTGEVHQAFADANDGLTIEEYAAAMAAATGGGSGSGGGQPSGSADGADSSADGGDSGDGEGDDGDEEDDDGGDDEGDTETTEDTGEDQAEDEEGEGQAEAEQGEPLPDDAGVNERARAEFLDSPLGTASREQDDKAVEMARGGGLIDPVDDQRARQEFLASPLGAGDRALLDEAVGMARGGGVTDPPELEERPSTGGPIDELRLQGGGAIDPVDGFGTGHVPEPNPIVGPPGFAPGGGVGRDAALGDLTVDTGTLGDDIDDDADPSGGFGLGDGAGLEHGALVADHGLLGDLHLDTDALESAVEELGDALGD